jgi:hypothetical protein
MVRKQFESAAAVQPRFSSPRAPNLGTSPLIHEFKHDDRAVPCPMRRMVQ